MGVQRSQQRVAQILGKTKVCMEQWSKKYGWVARAEQYDTEVDRRERLELSKLRTEQLRRVARRRLEVADHDWEAAQELRKRAAELRKMPTTRRRVIETVKITQEMVNTTVETQIVIEPAGWRQRDIALFDSTASKLERLGTDLPTEMIEVLDSTEDISQRVLSMARLAFQDMCAAPEFALVPKDLIAQRVAAKYGLESAGVLSETVN